MMLGQWPRLEVACGGTKSRNLLLVMLLLTQPKVACLDICT
jgi:hypothetical protein